MKATLSATVTMGGVSSQMSNSREQDGFAGVTPTATPAVAGTLTTRSSATGGVITCGETPSVVTGDKAVLTWLDEDGITLKHRYNVACTVATLAVTVSGGAGDDLPAQTSVINVALQVRANITFDFDLVDTLVASTNVRGVIAFMDSTDAEKLVIDMDTKGMALWQRNTGFPQPATGTTVTYVLVGSGDTSTTNFLPTVLALYDASFGSGY